MDDLTVSRENLSVSLATWDIPDCRGLHGVQLGLLADLDSELKVQGGGCHWEARGRLG